ncbi:MAG: radical SAM protein, partial [Lachnospiraceae bacterium]|nr:radical SAM protein [Lachnospiraceae bacterium]
MNNKSHIIKSISPDSPARSTDIAPGDVLLAIDGHELRDIFDYHYYSDDADITLSISHPDGSREEVFVSKYEGEDLGLTFENGLMDEYR